MMNASKKLNYRETGYNVPKAKHEEYYHTKSIVKARAYAVKMIQQSEGLWSWWDIYADSFTKKYGKPYTTVAYLGPRLGYVWYHGDVKVRMYADGRLKGRLRA